MTTETQPPTDLEALQENQRQAHTKLRVQLERFNWSMVPRKYDPDGQAFYDDPTAIAALQVYNQATNRLYYFRHSTRSKESSRIYYETHQKQRIAYTAAWRIAHLDRSKETIANWRRTHPDKVNEAVRQRRVTLQGAEGSHTAEEFKALCQELNNCCTYCGRTIDEVGPLVVDHATPISRGGDDNISNVLPACRYCNSSKGDKTVEEFLDYLERLSRRST